MGSGRGPVQGKAVGAPPVQRAAHPELRLGRALGSRHDSFEADAERAADAVMRAPQPAAGRVTLRPDGGAAGSEGARAPGLVEQVVGAPGEMLDASTRALMEPRFGCNFSQVRVHHDSTAAASARAINAQAYTVGQHIGFDAGAYDPAGFAGQRLIAHELAHVVQQSGRTAAGAVVRRQEKPPPGAPAPAAQPDQGDALRGSVHDTAKDALAKQQVIKSEDDIYDIRNGTKTYRMATVAGQDLVLRLPQWSATPMKNFTTCIEFGGQTFRDAVKSQHPGDAKAQQKIVPLYAATLKMMFQDVELQQTVEAFRKSLELYVKPMADLQGRRDKAAAAQEGLQKIETPDAVQKGQMQQKKMEISQLDKAIAQMEAQKAKLQTKIDQKAQELDDLRTKETSWVRPTPGLTGGRPKPGDYVLHGQPPKKSSYGVSKETTVALAPGGFTHIAVHDSLEVVSAGVELWKSIDGGGVKPDARNNYVRLSDLLVFPSAPKADTDASAAKAVLLGWIDVGKLAAGDEGAGKK